jgi:hypothetical protein
MPQFIVHGNTRPDGRLSLELAVKGVSLVVIEQLHRAVAPDSTIAEHFKGVPHFVTYGSHKIAI